MPLPNWSGVASALYHHWAPTFGAPSLPELLAKISSYTCNLKKRSEMCTSADLQGVMATVDGQPVIVSTLEMLEAQGVRLWICSQPCQP